MYDIASTPHIIKQQHLYMQYNSLMCIKEDKDGRLA